MNLINFLKSAAEKNPTKTGLVDNKRSLTFQELYEEVQSFSYPNSFSKKNIISLIPENSSDFVISYLRVINSGKIAHLIPPDISEKNLLKQLNSSSSGAIICSNLTKNNLLNYSSIKIPIVGFDERISQSTQNIKNSVSNELAYLIYTSGTTSEPKGVSVTHEMINFTTNNIANILGYSGSDVDILPLPLYHSFGLGCFHTSLCVGSTLVLLNNATNLEQILESLKKYNATTLSVIPATLTKFLKFERNVLEDYFSRIRLVMTNSTLIPKNTVQIFRQILKNGNLATYYGLTEASRSTFMIFDKFSGRESSVGRTAPEVQIKVVPKNQDESNSGEIWIKGNNVIKSYWNNPEADKNIVNGWLRTGDIGYFDEQNYLFLIGRSDDIINVGGEKITPYEIEEVVKQLPGIEDVVAFGIEHEIFGQVIKLNVVKSKDCDLDKTKILTHCIKNLEKFKIPSKIDFVESIPKTEHGKVKRFTLK